MNPTPAEGRMRRRFGAAGRDVPVLGQGTWELERADRRAAIGAIRLGLDLGMTHVDTAELYGAGRVEEIVGEALEGRRDEVFLVSKVLPENASRRGTIAACERSLERLRTDRLDCYLLHWESSHPLEETIAAFDELVARGKILSFGVSNFDEVLLDEAVAIAGEGKVACNQVLYHLEERTIEHALLPRCREHGVALVGYSPFAQGNLPSASSEGGRTLEAIAAAHGATRGQIALAYLVRDPCVFTIPKAARREHVRENAAAERIVLSRSDVERIEAAFPLGPRRAGIATL